MRLGTHGSVSVVTEGKKAGAYFDHEEGEGGWIDDDEAVRSVPTVKLIVAKYDYFDEAGRFVMQVLRYCPKNFKQRRPDPARQGGWIWSVRDQELFPYRHKEMLGADDVVIVEGEKDVDALARLGVVATTKPGGTGKWPSSMKRFFAGKNLLVIPDNDNAGRRTASATISTLGDVAASARLSDICAGMPLKSDVSDYIDAHDGITGDELIEVISSHAVEEPAKTENSGNIFHTENVGELAAVVDQDDFIEGLLIAGQMSVLYGPSNSGKTFLATDLAAHVSLGRAWRGREISAGAVVYVAAEGAYGIRNRMVAFREHYAVDGAFPFSILPSVVNFFDAEEDMERLENTVRAKEAEFGCGVALVVVDTLARVAAGADENASADMGIIIKNVDALCRNTGAHVMLVHHSGKDVAKGARGSSALRAATATEIEVEPLEGYSVARVTKQRDLEIAGEFGFALQVVELGTNARGRVVSSCVVVEHGLEVKKVRPAVPRGAAQKICFAVLRDLVQGETRVRDDVWRDACFEKLSGEQKHKWTSFRRAEESLVGFEFVGKGDGYVWII